MKTRLLQLLIRALTYLAVAIAAKTGSEISSQDLESVVLPIASGLAAALGLVLDRLMHGKLLAQLEAKLMQRLGLGGDQ